MCGYRARNAPLIAIFTVALLLVACSQPTTTRSAAYLRAGTWRISAVRVILTSAFPTNHIPPFDKTSTSATKAEQLYNALLALPVMPTGTYSCPADFGNVYHLMFYDGASRLVASATVKPDGCETAVLPDGSHRWAATDQSFWTSLADALNVSRSALSQTPHPDGPSAPTSLPNQP